MIIWFRKEYTAKKHIKQDQNNRFSICCDEDSQRLFQLDARSGAICFFLFQHLILKLKILIT